MNYSSRHLHFVILLILLCHIAVGEICYSNDGETRGHYNREEDLCCNGQIEKIRASVTRTCCGGEFHTVTTSGMDCCTSQMYDTSTHDCCNGSVQHKDSGQCCHGAWMDTEHTCCQEGPRLGIGQCCGSDKVVDPHTHMCCTISSQSSLVAYSTQTIESGQRSHFGCCGLGSYNRLDEECCEGVVSPKSPFKECCGHGLIDSRTHICCNGQSFIKDGKTKCCNSYDSSTPYNPDIQTCRGGRLYTIANGLACRGSTPPVYSPTLQSCCNNRELFEIPSIPLIQSCCGTQAYMVTDQICCNNQLYPREAGQIQECCGGHPPIDTATHICCTEQSGAETPLPKESDTTECCVYGNTMSTYDPAYQTCCHGNALDVRDGQCCGSEAIDPTKTTCCRDWSGMGASHSGSGLEDRCCGIELLADTQLCVKSGILAFTMVIDIPTDHPEHDAWCYGGSQFEPEPNRVVTYDSSEKECSYDGVPILRLPTEERCGGDLMDAEMEICCQGSINPKSMDGVDKECCLFGTNSYNPKTQRCIHNVVSDLVEGLEECGRKLYDSATQTCAVNTCVREKAEAERFPEFCGLTLSLCRSEDWYDPSEKHCCDVRLYGEGETCCNGRVYSTPGTVMGEGSCCYGIAYNPSTQMCCDTQVHNITNNEGMACCGERAYNPHDSQSICCEDNLWSTDDGTKTTCTGSVAHRPSHILCGNSVIDLATQICCQDNIYPREESTQCCGSKAYDSLDDSILCCANTSLYPKASGKECCHDQAIDPDATTCFTQGGQERGYPRDLAAFYCCEEGSYDQMQHTCCEGVLHFGIANGVCCGMEVVRNPVKETCCGGRLQPMRYAHYSICCNGIIYDDNQYSCCGDTPLNNHNAYKKCCIHTVYNIYEEVCHDGIISHLVTNPPVTTAERPQTSPTSSPADTITLPSPVIPLPPSGIVLAPQCENIPYNRSSQECRCGHQLLHHQDNQRCCNNTIYDSRNQTCLNGKVLRIRNGRPCGIYYSEGETTSPFVCCNGVFHRIKKGRDQCCGEGTFNASKDICCGGVVVSAAEAKCCNGRQIAPHEECCNGHGYEPHKSACCGGEVFDLIEIQAYNMDTTHCCPDGQVLNIKSGRCYSKECTVCKDQNQQDWRKKICRKHFTFLATLRSVRRTDGDIYLEAVRMTRLDREGTQWQTEIKDTQIVIKRECRCHWVVKRINKLEMKDAEADYLIMTDEDVGNDGILELAYDDYVMEANPKMIGKVVRRMVRCDT